MCKKNESECAFCKDGRTFGGEKEQGLIFCLLFFLPFSASEQHLCACACKLLKKKEVNVSHIYAIKKLDQEEMSYSYKVETTEVWRRCLSRF